jgi:hypothetical protein
LLNLAKNGPYLIRIPDLNPEYPSGYDFFDIKSVSYSKKRAISDPDLDPEYPSGSDFFDKKAVSYSKKGPYLIRNIRPDPIFLT